MSSSIMIYIVALAAFSLIGSGWTQEIKLPPGDPSTVEPCYKIPTKPPPFLSWDSARLIDTVWWEYITKSPDKPSEVEKLISRGTKSFRCNKPTATNMTSTHDYRFYWQTSCPYTVHWLSHFTMAVPKSKITETCYILNPCKAKIRMIKCLTKYCENRCQTDHAHVRNAICLENQYRDYKKQLVFCPNRIIKDDSGQYIQIDCRRYPQKCFKKIRIRVPQVCECWSCWDMYVTMPELMTEEKMIEEPLLRG